jgi:selenocysteine-specific translation elongation factor
MPTSIPKILVKKKITLDDLAAMCMREFMYMRETMASKQDVIDIRLEMATKQDIAEIRSDIAKMATKEDMADIKRLQIDHMFRIQRLEQVGELD